MADLREQLTTGLADRYRIERELGRGGMATVFLAHDLRHKRPVALKVLHPELAHTLGPERFQREIETVAGLQHPHILTVHDSGATAGQLWFTMPFVEGESLRDRLRREPQLPVEVALRITTEAARALQYAHEHGVIHRDIKPENLLLTSDGSTLVADFGIARALSGNDDRLTETGMSVGTPTYMSPEQSAGDRHLDARTDVYSLGTVLYEMLAGEPPFTGPTAQAVIAKRLVSEVPRVRLVRPSAPESVEHALLKALASVAADRHGSAGDFARALQPSPTDPNRRAGASPGTGRRRRVPAAAITLGLGIMIGLGLLFAWRRSHPEADSSGGKVLAVLPFENLGDSSDAYFADGVGDEVRGKLSQLAGLAVIARASSNVYRRTKKPPQQIARELGAEYLLTATVRWDKHPDGTSRVRVTPELIRLERGALPRTKWQQGFEAALTDVFQVQAEIAGQVAQALNVALGDSTKRHLASKPTQSLPAYDAFLRGEAAFRKEPRDLDRAIPAYEQALALDPGFVDAWVGLAEAQGRLYNQRPTSELAEAVRRAAVRAMEIAGTRSAEQQALAHEAVGAYQGFVLNDYARALTADSTAYSLAPGNAELLGYVGWDEVTLGRWEDARSHLEKAVRLDPRSRLPVEGLCVALLYSRHYAEAERALDHALQLMPADLQFRELRAKVALAQGNLPGAQAVLRGIPKDVNPTTLLAYVGSDDAAWALDDQQQHHVLQLMPSAFDDDRATWALALAHTYDLQGNPAKARAYGDSARLAFEQELKAAPQGAWGRAQFGLALAYSGHKAEAIREGQSAVALTATDAQVGSETKHQLARIYLLVGEPEKALDQLDALLRIPYYLSPDWLRIDPNFARLRGNPRFERLVNGR